MFAIFYWFALLQIAKNTHSKHAWKITSFLHQHLKQKNWKFIENDVQNALQNVSPKRGWPFWSAPGAFFAPQCFFNTKKCEQSASKMTPRVQNRSKNDPKGEKWSKKTLQISQKGSQRRPRRPPGLPKQLRIEHLKLPIIDSTNLETGPADCAKRLNIMFWSKSWLYTIFYNQNPDFWALTTFSFSLSN